MRPRALHHLGPALRIIGWLAGASIVALACGDTTSSSPPTRSVVEQAPEVEESEPAGPAVSTEAEPIPVRQDDLTDVETLAIQASRETTGDAEWIPVMAALRVKSWLATRYPGRYDLGSIYNDEWASGHPEALERESLDLGVYLDEPLPTLISVNETRTLGKLVEIEVVLEGGEALIRQETDDQIVGSFPGGTSRGLFILGQSDPSSEWRIHSVAELALGDTATAEGTSS
ncbi:MAG: hypothetical protein GY773_00265 [Actinomycetia bacterium]|nr:hypothetical protein [Actinomycetes bacterium]